MNLTKENNNNFTNFQDYYDLSDNVLKDNIEIYYSNYFLEQTRKINIFSVLIILVIGLIGNCLTILVFSQRRFRTNSSNIYLFSLAIVDALFLSLHVIEDTVRTYNDVYPINNTNETSFFDFLSNLKNVTDKFLLSCSLINYFRYVIRFISAFIIVAFTLQRLRLVYFPLSNSFKTKQSAWKTVSIITIMALISNSWVPFMFEIEKQHCDVKINHRKVYFLLTSVYIGMIMLLPILTIIISNTLILNKTNKEEKKRKIMQIQHLNLIVTNTSCSSTTKNQKSKPIKLDKNYHQYLSIKSQYSNNSRNTINNREQLSSHSTFRLKPFYESTHMIKNKLNNKIDSTKKLKNILILISFSYALLNIPYLITW
jgi:hypothetical protein